LPEERGCEVLERMKTCVSGEVVAIALGFEYEGDGEIEAIEATFVREGSGEEIILLGDARKEASVDRMAHYAAQLKTKITPIAVRGEHRCARLYARDRLDDWGFSEIGKLDLAFRVERTPRWLEVTKSEFL
jgi:hypothetical protein